MINLPVPYFCQRENKYIWYQKATKPIVCDNNPNIIKYNPGDSILETKKHLAPITCNITSLCMILHYFGITDDSPDDMLYKIFDSEEYKNDGKFSQWRTSDYPAEDAISQLEMAVDLIKDVVKELKIMEENIGYNR